jgi:hypothetical protein
MRGAIPQLPQYASMAWCSVKAQGQLYLYLCKCVQHSTSFLTDVHRRLLFQTHVPNFYDAVKGQLYDLTSKETHFVQRGKIFVSTAYLFLERVQLTDLKN